MIAAAVVFASVSSAAAADHYLCYEIKPTIVSQTPVGLTDAFGSTNTTVGRPERLCTPVDKNHEDPAAPADPQHLEGYRLRFPFTPVPNLKITNQFGTITLDATRPDRLLVPTAKDLNHSPAPLPAPTIDHFTCYRVRHTPNTLPFRKIVGVALEDQFGPINVTVERPTRLCVPVDKNAEDPGAEDHPGKLLCYKIRVTPRQVVNIAVFLNNQFGPEPHQLIRRTELCVPSPPNPTTTTTVPATTSTSTSSSTSTSTSTTTSTSPLCGNGHLDPGEQCDPPGSLTCPVGSPVQAFTGCLLGCVCPNVIVTPTTSTTTSTAPLCGNGTLNDGEQCDPPGSVTCPGGNTCLLGCVCPTTSTTVSTSTTSTATSTTTTSSVPGLCSLDLTKTANPDTFTLPSTVCKGGITSITFRYTAAGCAASDNPQGGKATCTSNGTLTSPVTITAKSGTPAITANNVPLNGQVTFSPLSGADMTVTITQGSVTETDKIHISCSQPIAPGDHFGSLEVVGFTSKDGGAVTGGGTTVQYSYKVTNTGATTVVNIAVTDDHLGSIGTIPTLVPGGMQTLTASTMLTGTTTNVAQASGQVQGAPQSTCSDSATATATAIEARECSSGIVAFLVKYTGPANPSATTVTFTGSNGASVTYNVSGLTPGDVLVMPPDDPFTIDATKHGQTKLGTKTNVFINGTLTEVFHTSCSCPQNNFVPGEQACLDASSPDNPTGQKGEPSPLFQVLNFK